MNNRKNASKRVLMILGSLPPMKCGVGDSMVILAKEIASFEKKVGILTSKEANLIEGIDVMNVMPSWSLKHFILALNTIKKWNPDVIHFQFPSLGYKTGFLPYFLTFFLSIMGRKVIQTWHEPPIKSPFARNNLERFKRFIFSFRYIPNAVSSGYIIEVEKNALQNLRSFYKPLIKKKNVTHIPVTSNIPSSSASSDSIKELRNRYSKDKKIISYFGFIFPHKGIDQIFEIADPLRDHIILMTTFSDNNSYHRELKDKIYSYKEWNNNFSITGFINADEVADTLMASDVVLLPFRTETTLRNGSVFAAMLQGTTIITTSRKRKGYDSDLNIYFKEPDDIKGMKSVLDDVLSKRVFKKKSTLLTWRDIAKKHIELYDNYLA